MKLYFVLSSNKFIAAISSIFKIKYEKIAPKTPDTLSLWQTCDSCKNDRNTEAVILILEGVGTRGEACSGVI